ncbi:MAG: DUF4065 domain-containing protein [Spirochaetota bacterium]|nr:DUF4065 domain-containing protein [Spirochaetota bacterium]
MLKTETRAIEVAKSLINQLAFQEESKGTQSELYLENLYIQKTLYFAQVLSLKFFDQELFQDDCQAWLHGPVIPEVYKTFRYDKPSLMRLESNNLFTEMIIELILEILDGSDAPYLEKISHEENKAWSKVYVPNIKHIIIPKQSIRDDVPQNFFEKTKEFFRTKREYGQSLITSDMDKLEF